MNIRLKSDDKAVEFYKTYTPKISIDRQKEYVLNAKVMNAMIVQETGLQNKHSEYGYTHKSLVRNTVISLCEELRKSFNHTLPKSESRLMEKFRDYKKQGYVALVSGTTGNQSARKIGPREGRILLRLKRSKFPVYTDMEIFDEFNRIVAERNARVICEEDRLKPVESPRQSSTTSTRPASNCGGMVWCMVKSPSRTSSCHNLTQNFRRCPIHYGMVTVRN